MYTYVSDSWKNWMTKFIRFVIFYLHFEKTVQSFKKKTKDCSYYKIQSSEIFAA